MKLPAMPTPFNVSQISLILELWDTRMLAPQETARRLYQECQSAAFSREQQKIIELLLELDDVQMANALLTFADDEARDLVSEQVGHDAQLSYVAT